MTMKEKIREAKKYVLEKKMAGYFGYILVDMQEVKNDAANIYGDTMEEYEAIWDAVRDL